MTDATHVDWRTHSKCPATSYGPARLPCQNRDPHEPRKGCLFIPADGFHDAMTDSEASEP